jgi:hypothetical protein
VLNHRALQRALFRMQLDPDFARRLRAGERTADLGNAELACLRAADPIALAADRDGARRAQFLRNVGSEFQLSIALLGEDALDAFPRSRDFHRAVQRGDRLPLALGRHLARLASARPDAHAIVALERGMARARRGVRAVPAPPRDHVVLAGSCALLELPDGTLDRAARMREGMRKASPMVSSACEHLLIRSHAAAPPARLRDVEVERLSPALARFLCKARVPLSRAARARIAAELDTTESEIEALASELTSAGILLDAR